MNPKHLVSGAPRRNGGSLATKAARMNVFDRGCCAPNRQTATPIPAAPEKPASAPKTPPADFMQFVCEGSVRDAAKLLRLSPGMVHQLRHGYWPDDPRRILRAWADYRARAGRIESSWFLRRVRSDGRLLHAGRAWSGVGLAQRAGELVAVARMPDGALLAQTLELPAQRIALESRP